MNKQGNRIVKKTTKSKSPKPSTQKHPLRKHQHAMDEARKVDLHRERLGLSRSRLNIPADSDTESAHREFFAKKTVDSKIEQDVKKGYVVRVEESQAAQLDDLDPELRAARPLTQKGGLLGQEKASSLRSVPQQAAGHSTCPLTMNTPSIFASSIRPTTRCSKCGSRLRGTSMITPLSRPPVNMVDESAPLCLGCSRLFSCVKGHEEKLDMFNWIIARKLPHTEAPKPNDQELMKLCKERAIKMKRRAYEHFTDIPTNFVTAQELSDSFKANGYNCYMVCSPTSGA